MSREMKFRAWDTFQNTMHYGVESGIYEDPDEIIPFYKILDFACYEVMQYIGLNDKNNRKIYEGDIVKYPDASRCGESYDYDCFDNIGVVEYDVDSLGYYFTNRETVDMEDICIGHEVEVIGNIYENPELLETEEQQ